MLLLLGGVLLTNAPTESMGYCTNAPGPEWVPLLLEASLANIIRQHIFSNSE